jgi:hypothetical protein
MSFDFPDAPTVGQVFQGWTWDGEKWTTIVGGKTPIYSDGSVAMAAQLTVVTPPVNSTHAASKGYVDSATPPSFPAGTVMLFYQAAAPTGWTKLTTQNDKALRVVSGAGGAAGGSNAFSTVMAQSVVGSHTLTAAEAPYITSSGSNTITVFPAGQPAGTYYFPVSNSSWSQGVLNTGSAFVGAKSDSQAVGYTYYCQTANDISVGASNVGGAAHNHPITMDIQYIDLILASKN